MRHRDIWTHWLTLCVRVHVHARCHNHGVGGLSLLDGDYLDKMLLVGSSFFFFIQRLLCFCLCCSIWSEVTNLNWTLTLTQGTERHLVLMVAAVVRSECIHKCNTDKSCAVVMYKPVLMQLNMCSSGNNYCSKAASLSEHVWPYSATKPQQPQKKKDLQSEESTY